MVLRQFPTLCFAFELTQITIMNLTILSVFENSTHELRRFLTGRVRCAVAAEDLMQEMYLRLQRIEQPHLIQDLRTYIFRIAANLAIDHLRAQGRRSAVIEPGADFLVIEDSRSNAEHILLAKEELQIVVEALKDLSPLCQQIFVLNRLEGMKHSAIATQLGISRSTVEKNIARALNHCRRRVNNS